MAAPRSTDQASEAHRCGAEGVRLVQQGRVARGVALLERAVALNPSSAELHHNLGVALITAGRLEQAAEVLRFAIALDPRIPTAHHFLAEILERLGQVELAVASYKAAVALRPDFAGSQYRLGQLYLTRRQRIESAAAFRAAAAAARGTVLAGIAEARVLEASGSLDEAIAAMRAVIQADPENGLAHALLGNLLAQSGLSAQAARHYERATELDPEMAAAWSGVATNRKFTAEDGPLIARMNAVLARPNLPPPQRKSVHFALGKAHEDLGNYEAAMRNFEAGARLRAGGGFNRDALGRRIDALIEATPPGYRDRQPDPGVEDATPILIVGMPRSGSTLIEQILSSHPEIAAGGELEFWVQRDIPRRDLWSLTATREATLGLADDYLRALRAVRPDAKRVTDKMLRNFMRLGLIHRIFPRATLIHCRRHPVDTALSIFTTDFVWNLDYASTRSDLVFYYRQYQRLMAHWREALPPDRFIEVDYEALVADPEPHTRRLISACGLEWNDACLSPHRNTRSVDTASVWQVRQPIYRTSVERWRRFEPWLGELRELAAEA